MYPSLSSGTREFAEGGTGGGGERRQRLAYHDAPSEDFTSSYGLVGCGGRVRANLSLIGHTGFGTAGAAAASPPPPPPPPDPPPAPLIFPPLFTNQSPCPKALLQQFRTCFRSYRCPSTHPLPTTAKQTPLPKISPPGPAFKQP